MVSKIRNSWSCLEKTIPPGDPEFAFEVEALAVAREALAVARATASR